MTSVDRRKPASSGNKRQQLVSRMLVKDKVSRIKPPAHPKGRAPLSWAQQRLWFLQELDPDSTQYNLPAAVRIDGPLDTNALEKCFSTILERHESLRTVFPTIDGEPVQTVLPPSPFELRIIDIVSSYEVDERMQQAARVVFNLESGPLFRAQLLRHSATQHILLLNAHHIVSDSWSAGILVCEIVAIYEGLVLGLRPSLPAPTLRYADYAAWQRDPEQERAIETQLQYWRECLSGELPVLELRSDQPRPAVASSHGDLCKRALPPLLVADLKALSRRENATLFMTLLSGFNALLSRYTNQDDIILGSPVAGRQIAETHDVIGCFVNTLALRTSCAGDPAFADLLQRVRKTCLQAYANEEAPLERVIQAVQPGRDSGRMPLFQAAFGLRHDPVRQFSLGQTKFEMLEIHTGMAKFDLMLELIESPGQLTAVIEYNSDLFDPETIDRMLGHYETLLTAAVSAPETPLSLLPLLTLDEEKHIREWNATERTYPLQYCLHEFIERQVDRTPDATALVFEDQSLTYRELERRANQLAHYLRANGTRPDTLVGIAMERSVELVVSLLAVLKAGGAYVPIDPEYPRERIAHMLEDANPGVLLTQERFTEMLREYPGEVIAVDAHRKSLESQPADRPPVVTSPGNFAYVIFTSGSTGRPKGAINTHRGIVNRLCWMQDEYRLNADDRVLQKTPFSFDVSVWEFFWPLMTGATLVVARPGGHRDAAYLARLITAEQITTLHFVPSMLHIFLDEPLISECSSLRRVICSGEALPVELEQRFFTKLDAELHNLYGPTEAAVDVTAWKCRARSQLTTVPIGRPIANTQIHLLDARMNRVPVGVAGELYIGGVNVGCGYLNRSDLTAEKFIPDPFRKGPETRLYRTGDLARYIADGAIEYLGRMDHQVKIRGFRIELGEIEAILNQHSSVRESVVVAVGESGEKRLAAYVVPAGASQIDIAGLSKHLRASLPDYMVPATFTVMESLPLSPNGKVDRRALPAPESASHTTQPSEFEAPRTVTEELLAQLWCTALRVERVGRSDDFFRLGGHSLLAAQLASRIRSVMSVDLPVRRIFDHPKLADLAATIDGENREEARPAIRPRASALNSEAPLSFAQQRLWILDQLTPGDLVYHLPVAVRIHGTLDYEAAKRSYEYVVNRHDSLRASFKIREGVAVQAIDAEHPAAIETRDIRGVPATEQAVALQRELLEHVCAPFDLTRGPLIRGLLICLRHDEYVFSFVMHHIVSDGWSVTVLLREWSAAYAAYTSGKAPDPAPLPLQYADYAVWQREWLEGAVFHSQMDYWRTQLQGVPMLNLPTDRPRPRIQTFRGARRSLMLSAALAERLSRLAREQHATLFMVLLGGFQALLARYSGQNDIAIGTPVANRNQAETEGLIGFFVNTLVLRTHLNGNPSFQEIVSRVREVCLGAFANQDLPFERLVEELRPERHLGANPLFQVMFTIRDGDAGAVEIPDATITILDPPEGISKFDMTMEIEIGKAGLRVGMEYDTTLFDANRIDSLLLNFETLLDAATKDPAAMLAELPIVNDRERSRMLVDWNHTRTDYQREATVPDLFRAIASETPNAIAIEFGDDCWSYSELDRRSDRIACRLRKEGVAQGSFVGLCMPRSAPMIAATLGILKAGCAYVPLDIGYPAERLRLMLEDSSISVVIAESSAAALLAGCAGQCRIINADDTFGQSVGQNEPAIPVKILPGDIAYVMFTSGSTGKPKGILVPHRGIVRLVRNTNYVQLGKTDRVAQVSNISFDAATFEIWGPLLNGGTVAGIDKETALAPASFAEAIEKRGITTLFVTTALFNLMAREVPNGFHCLKNLMFGGEAADAGAVRRVLSAGRPVRLMNVYGPTETTTFAAWHLINELPETATTVPIGRPIANTTFYVLDANRQPVPWGIPGELYIGGDGVALGYLRRPDLAAEKFVANPFSTDSADRLYRTGDLVRYRHDGAVEFLGRLDDQVKIRGFRIEPGEIDAALSQHPQLHQTLTIVREDTPGDKRVVSYCVPAEGFAFEPAGLRQFLGAHLPEYMLPGAFVAMESLPINVNGKVDRSLLPPPELLRNDAPCSFVAPRNSIEHSLCAIWAQLLGVEQVSLDDNFFAIGGHSLLATQVVSRIRDILKVEIPLRAIFEYQTIADLALYLESQHAVISLEPIRPLADREAAAPLSWSQQRVWFLDQLMPGTPLYNVPAITRFKGALNFPMLKGALSIVVNRHDALRTTFELTQDGPVQICGPRTGLAVSFTDLSLLKPAERELKARQLAEEEARRPFDLSTGPLIRAGVIRLDSADHLLLLTMHHIVCDGWSIGILIREAVEAWQNLLRGEDAELPALPLQYSDYAHWQRGTLSAQLRDSNLAWWTRHLSGPLPVLNLPTDRRRTAEPSLRGARYQAVLKASAVAGVKTIAETNQSTLFMVLLAAFNALLADYSGQQDIVVGSPVAGRTRSEIENLIGFFVNTLPLRTDLSADPTFTELLQRVRETTLGAFANQDVPFEMLVDEAAPGRSRSQNPLFQVAFVLQNATNFRVDLPGLSVEVQETDSGYSKFDLTLVVQETDGNLAMSWEYRAELFDQATIARMAYHFETFLEAVTANPDRRISELPFLTDAERQGLIRPENQIEAVYSSGSDAPGNADTGPRSEIENTLLEIWRQVLGVSALGIHDNFFEAGGDSILSIQVIARARAAGLHLTPRDIFDNQTIAALAAVARSLPAIDCEQHPVIGPAPLTPIQHWFLEQNLADAHHWNQSILLKFFDAPDPIALQQALDAVLNHHDALRARFRRTPQGWDQTTAPPNQPISLRFFDLSAHDEPTGHLERLASDIQAGMDLANGPLLHAAVFRLGDREWRLLIAIHHLVTDGVSWRILVEDLHTAYEAISSGRPTQLPPKTTSYREWGEKLAAEAGSPETQIEAAYWRSTALAEYTPLPLDNPIDPAANTRGNCDSATVTLDAGETAQLLRDVPKAYRTQINDVLLTALASALYRWTGMSSFLVDLESHGRDAVSAGVDVSRTVGWFTSSYPVRLNLPDGDDWGRALTSIKEQLRRVPRNGAGHGILRYLANDELALELASAPVPEVSFNYLGQFDQSFGQASLFAPAMEPKGKEFSPHSQRLNLLEFNGNVLGGHLHITCVYSRLAHKSATVEKLLSYLLEELKAIIVHCMTPESGAFTASDFPLARLDDEKLGKLARLISKPV